MESWLSLNAVMNAGWWAGWGVTPPGHECWLLSSRAPRPPPPSECLPFPHSVGSTSVRDASHVTSQMLLPGVKFSPWQPVTWATVQEAREGDPQLEPPGSAFQLIPVPFHA